MHEKTAAGTLRKTMKMACCMAAVWMAFIFMGCRFAPGEQYLSTVPDDVKGHHFKTYFLKQKAWTIGDHFNILDNQNNIRFVVHGDCSPLVKRLRFYDTNGKELAVIKQRLLLLKKQYQVFRDRKLWAEITKKIKLFKGRFNIEVHGSGEYMVGGNFSAHRYTFIRDGKPVAFVRKKWLTIGDRYRIDIDPDEDDVLVLISAVVIDMASHDHEYRFQQIPF